MSIFTGLRKPQLITRIAWMTDSSVRQAVSIDMQCSSPPWTQCELAHLIRQQHINGRAAMAGDRMLGFVVYEFHGPRVEILRLAVHPDCRFLGVGRQLLGAVTRMDRTVWLTVRETNLPFQVFLRACGFRAEGVSRGFFADTAEDGYRFRHAARECVGICGRTA